jgi:hypothetical protein
VERDKRPPVLSAQRKDPISISLLATEQAELALGSDEIQVGVLALHQSVLDGNHIDAVELHAPTLGCTTTSPSGRGCARVAVIVSERAKRYSFCSPRSRPTDWLPPGWQSSSVEGEGSSGPVRYLSPVRVRSRSLGQARGSCERLAASTYRAPAST